MPLDWTYISVLCPDRAAVVRPHDRSDSPIRRRFTHQVGDRVRGVYFSVRGSIGTVLSVDSLYGGYVVRIDDIGPTPHPRALEYQIASWGEETSWVKIGEAAIGPIPPAQAAKKKRKRKFNKAKIEAQIVELSVRGDDKSISKRERLLCKLNTVIVQESLALNSSPR